MEQKQLFTLMPDIFRKHLATEDISTRETHISKLFLVGKYVFKFKKELNLGFLDFSTLKARKLACYKELKLNQRYAPKIYQSVIAITSKQHSFEINGDGEVVEYAVQMLRFNEDDLFCNLIKAKLLTDQLMIELVKEIVSFQKNAEMRPEFWNDSTILEVVKENLDTCFENSPPLRKEFLQSMDEITRKIVASNLALIRKRQGTHVKLLHGDLHLGNICLFEGKPTLFDGIEFSDLYACCDCFADFAFLLMDLEENGSKHLFQLALNTYLELTDDFEGLTLLPLYLSYRAMVRSKIACLSPSEGQENQNNLETAIKYSELAYRYLSESSKTVIAIGGLSGSGKSTLARELASRLKAIVIRQDAIRKNIFGISLDQPASQVCYSKEATNKTEAAVLERLSIALKANQIVIVDATCRNPDYRERLEHLATQNGLKFIGIWCEVDDNIALERIRNRKYDVSDADQHVFMKQKASTTRPENWKLVNTNQPACALATHLLENVLN